jgi:hypothetical protein
MDNQQQLEQLLTELELLLMIFHKDRLERCLKLNSNKKHYLAIEPVNPVLQEQKTLLLFIIKQVPPFWHTFTKPAGQVDTGAVVVTTPSDISHNTPEIKLITPF